MTRRLKAVLFDMDGVVINSAAVSNALLIATGARHGVRPSQSELEELRGAGGMEFWSRVKDRYSLPESVEHYYESYDVEAEISSYNRSLLALGFEELVRDADASGIRVGIVTSATCWRTGHVLDLLTVRSSVSCIVCSDGAGRLKPNPDPYLRAARTLGVSPSQCLAVEDSIPGVTAARDAGMTVLAFSGFEESTEAARLSDGVVHDFRTVTAKSLEALHTELSGSRGNSDGGPTSI